MRILFQKIGRNIGGIQQRSKPSHTLLFRKSTKMLQRLAKAFLNFLPWVKAVQAILKHGLNMPVERSPAGKRKNILAVPPDAAYSRFFKTADKTCQGTFSAAAFADKRDRLSVLDRQRKILQHRYAAFPAVVRIVFCYMFYFEHRFSSIKYPRAHMKRKIFRHGGRC